MHLQMALTDALVSAVMGYVVVFFGLCLLMGVIAVMGKAMAARRTARPAPELKAVPAPVREAPAAPGSAGRVKLYDVSDREAALLMAIVAHKLGKPVNQLRFKSIKEVKE